MRVASSTVRGTTSTSGGFSTLTFMAGFTARRPESTAADRHDRRTRWVAATVWTLEPARFISMRRLRMTSAVSALNFIPARWGRT
jgi:hypothetical protein